MEKFEENSFEIKQRRLDIIDSFAQELSNFSKEKSKRSSGGISSISPTTSHVRETSNNDLLDILSNGKTRKSLDYIRHTTFKKTPREIEEEKNYKQQKTNQLISWLRFLDFWNYEAVLDWVCEFQEMSVGAEFDKWNIISTFETHNYQIWANTWVNFNSENAENFARYLVWQSLYNIQKWFTSYNIIHQLTNDWKQKFSKKPPQKKSSTYR